MSNILLGFMLFLCAMIGTACALAPFFLHINNKINKRYEMEDNHGNN
jgi:hypothetical protein